MPLVVVRTSLPKGLVALVAEFVRTGGAARELLEAVRQGVHRVLAHQKDHSFPLGRRDAQTEFSVVSEVFVRCSGRRYTWYPFRGRTPFVTYVEEAFEEPVIRYHTFTGWLSVTKELLSRFRHENRRRDPYYAWRATLYTQIGRILVERAEAVAVRSAKRDWWRLGEASGAVPDGAAMAMLDRRVPGATWVALREDGAARAEALPGIVCELLSLCGRPMAHSALLNLLATRIGGPPPNQEARLTGTGSDRVIEEQMIEGADLSDEPPDPAIGEAVRRAWDELDATGRVVFVAAARGESAAEMRGRLQLPLTDVQVSLAIKAANQVFINHVAALSGVRPDPNLTPRRLAELIAAVVRTVVPELEHGL